MHNFKGEELTEIEAKAYLKATFPYINIEIKDKPDLRIKTSNGEIGIEVVTSYPQKQIKDMHKYGNTNTYESNFESIISCFRKKQSKVLKYEKVSKMMLFIISGTYLLWEDERNIHELLKLLLNNSNEAFSMVYLCDIEALYGYDLVNKKVYKITDFHGDRSVIALKVRKEWEG